MILRKGTWQSLLHKASHGKSLFSGRRQTGAPGDSKAVAPQRSPFSPDIFEMLKESGNWITKVIENTPSGICITDEHGIFEYVNPAYCSIYGYESRELIGKHFTMVVPEMHRASLSELHDRYIAGAGEVRGEWPVRKKSGEPLFILADAVRITGMDGRAKKVTFIVDITARKRAEEELVRGEKLLREAVATKDKFFSIIAHDLRNPFQALCGGAELLMLDEVRFSPSKVLEYGKTMYQAAQSANILLDNLLTWARSQTGAISCKPRTLHLSAEVQRAAYPLLNKAKSKEIRLELSIPRSMTVSADPDMLNTILNNLVGNALKFSNRGDTVSVTALAESGQLIVSVSDSGIGMEPEVLDKLFHLDSRRTSTGTAGEHGTGLGLILCKEFVEMNGGRIWAESSIGRGSNFFFTLPRVSPQAR